MSEPKQDKHNDIPPLCPIAAIWSCKQCPIYRVCPATTILGDKPISNGDRSDLSSEEK